MAYILRHHPDKFNLEPDLYGYIKIDELISTVKKKYPGFDRSLLNKVVSNDPKNRYKIKGEKIRARYGHSISVQPEFKPVRPPNNLYHGTSPTAAQNILQKGLKSMNRQFVHLSLNKKDARQVGSRHASSPIILEIDANEAYNDGIEFYHEKGTYLAKFIPSTYIRNE